MIIERVKGVKIGGEKHEKQKDGQTKHVTECYFINPTMPICDMIFLRGRGAKTLLNLKKLKVGCLEQPHKQAVLLWSKYIIPSCEQNFKMASKNFAPW